VHGEHGGFHDLFVPVVDASGVRGILAAGPFATSRPTSVDILERWFALTHLHGRLADPGFSEYVALTLSTLTLEGPLFGAFESLIVYFARLVEGRAVSEPTATQIQALHEKLMEARYVERSTERVRSMVNERTAWTWSTEDSVDALSELGLRRAPEHVVVGLLSGRLDDPDSIDGLVRRDAFQRACVALARKQGDVACGKIGDHGVAFLLNDARSEARVRSRLGELVARSAETAVRFGLKLHAGTGTTRAANALPGRYQAALRAAEKALSHGLPMLHGEPHHERSPNRLRHLRLELADNVAEQPNLLLPRFDQYVEEVLTHSGYRIEPARAHLQAAIERLAEPLLASGALDEKSFGDLYASLERAVEEARTVATLVEPYRRAITDIESILKDPTFARHNRGTQRAVQFIREHLAEPLTLSQVARVAGFAPDYFSRLFKRDQGTSFESYLQKLRLGRAQAMLAGSSLSIGRVSHICGLRSRSYFHRTFKRALGMTPAQFRASKPTS
jgi:AraC-like DNA-binding protein